jgi:hypothetical protein
MACLFRLIVAALLWFTPVAVLAQSPQPAAAPFVCGYAFGHCAEFQPWATGLSMVAVGAALVGVAIDLGA